MIMNECLIGEIQPLMEEYVQELSSPFDSFLEKHILSSTFYALQDEMKEVGYYAIHDGQLLTQFYIRRSHRMYLQKMFGQVLERHAVKSLFVPTCDELLLSLAIDKDFPLQKKAALLIRMISNKYNSFAEIFLTTMSDGLHMKRSSRITEGLFCLESELLKNPGCSMDWRA
jgi:hypothetical protein